MHTGRSRVSFPLLVALLVAVAACSAPTPSQPTRQQQPNAPQAQGPRTTKSLTLGITSGVQAMSVLGAPTTSGGWHSLNEVHSNGLITSDVGSRRAVGRLAERVPAIDDGSISVLPDGRMRVIFHLRNGVTWQDGTPFTSRTLAFSHRLNSDPGIPSSQRDAMNRIESVEAPDDYTFTINYKEPYYLGASLGVRFFWPLPEHILGPAYERYLVSRNADDVVNDPYWTSGYTHLGPFRLTSFDPSDGLTLEAYDGYFLGRPKVDVVRIRTFSDENTLFSNLLANSVDMFPDIALASELGFQLKDRWESGGGGTVHVKGGITWFLAPQWRQAVQTEPANLDPRVRAALYHALDREALSEGLQAGHPEFAAWSMLPPGDALYDSTKDAMRRYAYDPDRSKALLTETGWTAGPDGIMRNSVDGRRFHNAMWTTPGRDREIAAFSSYWRRIGLEVDEFVVPAAQVRNLEYRAQYPNWESTAQGAGDAILGRMDGPPATAETRWVGERGGFDDPRAAELLARFRSSLSPTAQAQGMKAISDYVADTLPFLIIYYLPDHVGARKGVKAFDDVEGGAEAAQPYGTYSRNSHLWDIQ